eukprot:2285267-Amphidinium_carterae.1
MTPPGRCSLLNVSLVGQDDRNGGKRVQSTTDQKLVAIPYQCTEVESLFAQADCCWTYCGSLEC